MKLNNLLITLLIIGLASSCKEEKKEKALTQMELVIAIHDEVMPKMGTMAKLAGELSSKEDSTVTGMEYRDARRKLQEARDAMMQWMQDFGNKFDTEEVMNTKELGPQKQIWLDEEEERIKAVRDHINTSIKEAEVLLNTRKD